MRKASKAMTEIDIAKILMMQFVDDVVRGVHPRDAGWKGSEVVGDAKCDFVEIQGNRVRIYLDALSALSRHTRKTDNEAQRLLATCSDIAHSVKVEECVRAVAEKAPSRPDVQGSITAIGWWKMLETSDFSVDPSSVIEAGFNFSDWFVNTSRYAPTLALEVANARGSISWDIVARTLKEIDSSLPAARQPDPQTLGKVKTVLKWDAVLAVLSEPRSKTAVEALAFLWFVDFLCEVNCLVQDEACAFVQSTAWNLLCSHPARSAIEAIKEIDGLTEKVYTISRINDRVTTDWARIIRLPW